MILASFSSAFSFACTYLRISFSSDTSPLSAAISTRCCTPCEEMESKTGSAPLHVAPPCHDTSLHALRHSARMLMVVHACGLPQLAIWGILCSSLLASPPSIPCHAYCAPQPAQRPFSFLEETSNNLCGTSLLHAWSRAILSAESMLAALLPMPRQLWQKQPCDILALPGIPWTFLP